MKLLYTTLLSFCAVSGFAQNDIFDAARTGNVEAAKAMVQINADTLASENGQGYSPLILAAYHDQTEFIQYLVEQGIDVSGSEGEPTALQAVCYKGFTETCAVLLEAGANPNYKDPNGMSPLHYAAQFNHINIVNLLLEAGADVNATDLNDRKPLDYAVLLNHTEVVSALEKTEE
ncbi:MAG: hypothetical protein EP346_10605 [Bacteroidetes bacterium]|nr:MAG: hypothetical protein EP346_10605 [Bacteroidota bacterium]